MRKIKYFIICIMFIFCSNIIASDYSYTKLYLNSTPTFIKKIQYILSTKTAVVFASTSFQTAAQLLTKKFKIPIYIENGLEDLKLKIVEENIPVDELVNKIQQQTNSFLVYRNGYLVFVKKIRCVITLNTALTKNILISLTRHLISTNSEIYTNPRKLTAKLDSLGLVQIRDFLIENNLSLKVLATDAVLPIEILN